MTVQTGLDCGIVLRSGPKIRDWIAYKSVRFGPVPVSRSGLVSLVVLHRDWLMRQGSIQTGVVLCHRRNRRHHQYYY